MTPAQAYDALAEYDDCLECYDHASWDQSGADWISTKLAAFREFTSRNSATHGRSVGLGVPLRGTSWLNRPYEASLDFGAILMTGPVSAGADRANDKFAALSLGWDWDHYWGTQARLGWATPDLTASSSSEGSDNLFLADVSLMYYPWGDSRVRPYWRIGMGLTDVEFVDRNEVRQQEYLYTVPLAIGVKHQMRRWLVWRFEIADNIAFGLNDANTMHNLTLTAGIEARYGGRPGGYWAWRPRGSAW